MIFSFFTTVAYVAFMSRICCIQRLFAVKSFDFQRLSIVKVKIGGSKMPTFTIDGKRISVFPGVKVGGPAIYLHTFSDEGQKVFAATQASDCPPFTLVAISDLDWNHDMVPWNSPPAFKNAEPTGGGTTICVSSPRRLFQRQRRRLMKSLVGEGSPGTLWRGCLPCMRSTRRIYFLGWAVCLALSGFPE